MPTIRIGMMVTALLPAILMLCTQFPTRYERIEPDKLRSLCFSYQPFAEGAPGDTINVRAFFGGEKVVSVSWTYSTDHVMDGYGTDTVINIKTIPLINEVSRLPDSADISFVIPDSIFFSTRGLSSRVYDAARAALPPGMQSMTQRGHAAFLKDLMAIDLADPAAAISFVNTWGPAMGVSTLDSAGIATIMSAGGTLLYVFSATGVLYATATSESGETLKIKGDFTMRYNRKLAGTPFASLLPVNRSPAVRWIGVYAVKGKGAGMFHPGDTAYEGDYTFTYLYNEMFPDSVNDTILIDTGYSYFFATDSGMVSYTLKAGTRVIESVSGTDTTWRVLDSDSIVSDTSIDKFFVPASKDTFEYETWSYDWQYENIDLDSVTEPLDSLFMLAGRGGSWIVGSLPSLDPNMTHARIWITVRDSYIEFNRPVGMTVRTCEVYFRYSEVYRNRSR